jgi:OOP family OmpA-OmpF porin
MKSQKIKKSDTAEEPPPHPPAVAPPSFMVFFDWDRSNLSAQAAGHDPAGGHRLQVEG